ncbi:MAG TPA: hypothetical protein VMI75_18750 [Polyangiaceae bacterium]|nr:hypothetical protein [Polyangiaceae bacterium]
MSGHVAWDRGGEARIVSLRDDAIALVSSVPSPPGSRLEGTLAGEPPARLRIKVHACKRRPDESFDLEGRTLDMTREVRERVMKLAAAER